MLDPSGRTIMISGANRGLGNAIARRLLDAGYNVSAGARDRDALAEALRNGDDERLLCHPYDATRSGSDREWIDATVGRFGSLDGLVNNAGILDTSSLDDLEEGALDDMWQVNVKAPLRMIQLSLDHLRSSGHGRVVNVASLSGVRVAGTFSPGYAMTKHAVIALTEATKQVGWDDGIRVTAVFPAESPRERGTRSRGRVRRGRWRSARTERHHRGSRPSHRHDSHIQHLITRQPTAAGDAHPVTYRQLRAALRPRAGQLDRRVLARAFGDAFPGMGTLSIRRARER